MLLIRSRIFKLFYILFFHSGHLESVKFLIGNRASLKEADNLGRLPLDLAEEYQHQDVVDFLKACNKEESNPKSGLALLRKDSR